MMFNGTINSTVNCYTKLIVKVDDDGALERDAKELIVCMRNFSSLYTTFASRAKPQRREAI